MQNLKLAIAALLITGVVSAWLAVLRRWFDGRPAVDYQPRLRAPWTGLDVLLLAFAWPALELMALRMLPALGYGSPREAWSGGGISVPVLAAATAAHLVWVAMSVTYLQARIPGVCRQLGFDLRRITSDARLGGVAFLAALVPIYAVQFLMSKLMPPTDHPLSILMKEQSSSELWILAAVSAVLVAPLSEELLFRVILQGWLERQVTRLRRYRRWPLAVVRSLPMVASSAAFAAMHQNFNWPALFVLALVLGYLYRQTHRIYPSLVLHMCINGLAVLALMLGFD